MGRLLAIDYGRKRTGLAVSDENRIIAGPLPTLPSHRVIAFLKDYCVREQVDCFVVGYPVQMNGTPSESIVFIDPFIKALRREFPGIAIAKADERFTSKMAAGAIARSGLKKKDRQDKALIDQVSAVLILQNYMEYINI